MSSTQKNSPNTLGLVAIMRNESAYILEWISYYRALGVSRIVIYDNGENYELLVKLAEISIIDLINWPSIEGVSPQLSAYSHAVDFLAGSVEFITFLDADEFLVVNNPIGLNNFLEGLPSSTGAIAVNQRIFGSSGELKYRNFLTIERFQRACPIDHPECRWGKSIYRLNCIDKIVNSHRNSLKSGEHLLANGRKAFANTTDLTTEEIDFSILQLNHYMTKSKEEFDKKKNRGAVINTTAAARAKRYESISFFENRENYSNLNHDTKILRKIGVIINEMEKLLILKPDLKIFSPLTLHAKDYYVAENNTYERELETMTSSDNTAYVRKCNEVQTYRDKLINYEPWCEKTSDEIRTQLDYQASLISNTNIKIGKDSFISPMAHISGKTVVGNGTLIAANAMLRGDIKLGNNCSINANAHLAGNVTLGDGVRVAPNASLIGFNHISDDINTPIYKQGLSYKGIKIGSNTWIGANAVILDGVSIGEESIIGGGAVVSSDVPPFSVVGGNPARIIRNRASEYLSKKNLQTPRTKHNIIRSKIFAEDPYVNFKDFRPLDLQGWGSYESIFEEILVSHRPKTIVEIGTWKGASAVHQASIARKLGLECEIVCVDTWLGNWQHWSRSSGIGSISDLALRNGFPSLFNQFMSNIILLGFKDEITPLPLPGIAAAKLFEHLGLTADLVYIDGDHEYEAVLQDILMWDTVLSNGGILFGDDLHFPGVRRAVDEFSASYGRTYREVGGKFVFEAKIAK